MEKMNQTKVEFSEGTYKSVWLAIVKTKDNDLLEFFKEQVEKVPDPVIHYTMIKDYIYDILIDLEKQKTELDINQVLKNLRKYGYHKKYYS